MITLKFHLNLVKYTKTKEIKKNITKPVILKDLIEEIDIPINEIGFIFKNGKWDTVSCVLNTGDTVEIYPFLSGG